MAATKKKSSDTTGSAEATTVTIPASLKKQAAKKDETPVKLEELSSLDQQGHVKAIIETPRGSKNKYVYDPESGLFECSQALHGGMTFPFDFGFIPSTRAEDGDPLDIIILMDEPAFPGCLVHARVIGVLEASQAEPAGSKNMIRNDRLLGVHLRSVNYGAIEDWHELPKAILDDFQTFLELNNQCKGKEFHVHGWKSPKVAYQTLSRVTVK
jgi:inorganic pyrophosphatase